MIRLTRKPGCVITDGTDAGPPGAPEAAGRPGAAGAVRPLRRQDRGHDHHPGGSLAEAEAVAAADPLVASGMEDWEVREWVITGGEGRPLEGDGEES